MGTPRQRILSSLFSPRRATERQHYCMLANDTLTPSRARLLRIRRRMARAGRRLNNVVDSHAKTP